MRSSRAKAGRAPHRTPDLPHQQADCLSRLQISMRPVKLQLVYQSREPALAAAMGGPGGRTGGEREDVQHRRSWTSSRRPARISLVSADPGGGDAARAAHRLPRCSPGHRADRPRQRLDRRRGAAHSPDRRPDGSDRGAPLRRAGEPARPALADHRRQQRSRP